MEAPSPDIESHINGFLQFAENHPEYEFDSRGEVILHSEKYGYAGTCDCVGRNKETGKLVVFDWKTRYYHSTHFIYI